MFGFFIFYLTTSSYVRYENVRNFYVPNEEFLGIYILVLSRGGVS
jgi:hypothetical protein